MCHIIQKYYKIFKKLEMHREYIRRQEMYKKRWNLYVGIFLTVFLFFAVPVRSEAAWAKNADGTYSFYRSNGKKAVNTWINGTYYVNADGIRQTGWLTYKNKTYFLNKSNGKKITKTWVKTGGAFYYFNANGVMVKNRKVGQYYVGSDGKRLYNAWAGDLYLGSNGKIVKGLQEINGKYYYFNSSTGKKSVSCQIVIKETTWQFDQNGEGTVVTNSAPPQPKITVESTYYSDPYVDDETLLGGVIYCEAGNQSYVGQVAVGMVIMNRIYSPLFPETTVREAIYSKTQFTPARNGSLTKALNNPQIVTDQCRKAAKKTLQLYKNYVSGKKMYLNVGQRIDFSEYLFFMTQPAYERAGLKSPYLKIGDHVFFKLWQK